MRNRNLAQVCLTAVLWAAGTATAFADNGGNSSALDAQLRAALQQAGFTGAIESTLLQRLGRPINTDLANLGKLLFFDKAGAVHSDNMCAGCHAPNFGLGDSQSIAIGVQNNNIVGPDRQGPRNQRRTPTVVNTVFYPALMWNGRFNAASGDPFNNTLPFNFPPPDQNRFPGNDPRVKVLLQAQAHMPPTELTEVAGYTGTAGKFANGVPWVPPAFWQFDDGKGSPLPAPDAGGFFNEPIRQFVLAARLNTNSTYVKMFRKIFPTEMAQNGGNIDFFMFGRAIAEFEFTQVFANAPIDQYARGSNDAMTDSQKRGALLFFGKAACVQCHAVSGRSNEMFSDFRNRVAGVPQIAPFFGIHAGNVIFDGPNADEDFGLEQISGNSSDRYKFRTAPLRNLAVSPALFHNGAYTKLEDAIQFHLDAKTYARKYDAGKAGVDADLTYRLGPIKPVLDRLDPLLQTTVNLSSNEFSDLVEFVRNGLLDPRAAATCSVAPASVPSGASLPNFQGCGNGSN